MTRAFGSFFHDRSSKRLLQHVENRQRDHKKSLLGPAGQAGAVRLLEGSVLAAAPDVSSCWLWVEGF